MVVALLAAAGASCGRRGPASSPAPAALIDPAAQNDPAAPVDTWVDTEDGATVALRRYPAAGPPVILVHGISSNHRTWDLDADRSLARALQARGLDAWLLDLRGHGLAQRDGQGRAQRVGFGQKAWTMDDYGRYDLPAAIGHVQQRTGWERVGYVGHSMGGMVAAIYVSLHGDAALSSLVVVGSPIDFGHPEPLLQVAGSTSPMAAISGTVPTPALARAAALLDRSPFIVDELLFNPDNVSPEARKEMYRSIVSPLSRGEVGQLRGMLAGGAFRSADGQIDYRAGLAALRVPLLVIAGRGDSVAPVDRVAPWIDAAGSVREELVVASRANGFQHDYGHLDLAMGDAAARELHPRIIAWLEQGAARTP